MVGVASPSCIMEGVEEAVEVFARFNGADVEDEWVGQIVGVANALEFGRVGNGTEAFGGGFVDDVDFFLGYVEGLGDVLLGMVGDGDDGGGAAGDEGHEGAHGEVAGAGVVLAVGEEGGVVDGEDVGLGLKNRREGVGKMTQRRLTTANDAREDGLHPHPAAGGEVWAHLGGGVEGVGEGLKRAVAVKEVFPVGGLHEGAEEPAGVVTYT